MLSCDQFSFASAPRTATDWFVRACSLSKITLIGEDVHSPPPTDHQKMTVSIVRHPFYWLVSLYLASGMYDAASEDAPYASILQLTKEHATLESFLRVYLSTMPGAVTKMFDAYQASTVIRLEDLPYSAADFLDPFAVLNPRIIKLRPTNCRIGQVADLSVRFRFVRDVVRSEHEFCCRYDYA